MGLNEYWKNVDLGPLTTSAMLNGLADGDKLRFFGGSGIIKILRQPSGGGPWIDWSLNDCEIALKGKLNTGAQETFTITIRHNGVRWEHEGTLTGPITGATWTAEEGP